MTELKYKEGDRMLIESEVLEVDHNAEDGKPYHLKFGNSNYVRATQKEVEDIPSQQKPEFEVGEEVEISDDGIIWRQRIFLSNRDGLVYYVSLPDEINFKGGGGFYVCVCKYVRKIQPQEIQENKLKDFSLDELLAEIKRRNEEK